MRSYYVYTDYSCDVFASEETLDEFFLRMLKTFKNSKHIKVGYKYRGYEVTDGRQVRSIDITKERTYPAACDNYSTGAAIAEPLPIEDIIKARL